MPNTVTVANVARQQNVDPKIARSRLRRAINRGVFNAQPVSETRWEFDARASRKLKKIIANG